MVSINKETCIGCGTCESVCPAAFKMGDDNKAEVISQKAPCIKQAIEMCPVDAIIA